MGFAFRLERVLSVRRIQEEEARERHAAAQEALRQARAGLESRQRRLESSLEELDALKRRDELTSQALYLHSLHAAGLRREIELARAGVAEAAARAEESAARLLEAHQAREALERLREREHASWRRRQARVEAREIDEIAVTRHRAREEENHGP